MMGNMKRGGARSVTTSLLVAGVGLSSSNAIAGVAAESEGRLGCTAVVYQGSASVSGAAFAGMNADCSNCDNRVAFVAPKENIAPGTMKKIYDFSGFAPRWLGHGRGSFYEPKTPEEKKIFESGHFRVLGEIPENPKGYKYGYYESVLPLMNDAGLGLGESSCAARLMNVPAGSGQDWGVPGTEGLLDITVSYSIYLSQF